MGAMFKKQSRQQTVVESLSVKIYNKERDGDLHRIEEGSTCENVCLQIGQKLEISPTMLHCFGLQKIRKSSKVSTWLSPMEELRLPSEPEEIHFRMRFIPICVKEYGCFKTQSNHPVDTHCLRYLYWQIYWDCLHDKIVYDWQEEQTMKVRGLTVLGVVIQMRQHTEFCSSPTNSSYTENLKSFLKSSHRKFRSFFPSSIVRTFSLERYTLEKHMMDRVEEYQGLYPWDNSQYSSLALMKSFMRCILPQGKHIFCELYPAYSVQFDAQSVPGKPDELKMVYKSKEEVNVIIDMGRAQAELFINRPTEKRVIQISRLSSLRLEQDQTCNMFKVQLVTTDSPPEVLYFDEKHVAESFLTCLEGNYRIRHNYYQSLCKPLEPKAVRDINLVKAHGPVSTEYVKQKIEKHINENGNNSCYVLYKSLTDHGVFELVRNVKGSETLRVASLGKLISTKDGYSFDSSAPLTMDLRKLMHDKIQEMEGLQPGKCLKIQPKFEGCDVLQEIFMMQEELRIPDEDEEEALRRLEHENQPKVFMKKEVEAKKYIGKGFFTEVYQAQLHNGETVIMKRLRRDEIITRLDRKPGNSAEILSQLEEAFEEGFDTLLKLNNPKYFLNCVGVSGQTKLLKEEKFGNLKYFLETIPRYGNPLTMHHLQAVSIQLADALDYMETKNCFHGNLHCGNIIVTKFIRHEMLVKITDPGMVHYYNKLNLDTVCNRNRLPWIAPELYENLQTCTIQSEIFSYGMTLWQMYNEGQSPCNYASLMSKSVTEICEFFTNEQFQLPCPIFLKPCNDDSKTIKQIKKHMLNTIYKCCMVNQEDRLSPKEILKDLHGNLQESGNEYHDYNIIYEGDSRSYPIQSSGSAKSGQGTGDTSGIVSYSQPLPVPINDTQRFAQNVNEREKPKTGRTSGPEIPVPILEPGCELANKDQPAEMVCPVHPAPVIIQQAPTMGLSWEPIVSDVKFIIPEGKLSIDKKKILGSGYYGHIYRGTLEPSSSAGIPHRVDVAVKALKVDQEERFCEEFKKEASIMEKLEHRNIVKFYGIYKEGKYMVMELVERGSLYGYVQSCRRDSTLIPDENQLRISLDIASGMEYLNSECIIHCDLAARNVLLTSDLRGKVSDFGLSRILCQEKDYYRRSEHRTIPILWCAPEWIGFKKYFYKSDVWSFGVVLWEIYTYGKTPIIGKEHDLNKFYKHLYECKRLPKPKTCSDEIYTLMLDCWKWEPDSRKSFIEIKGSLKVLLDKLKHKGTSVTSTLTSNTTSTSTSTTTGTATSTTTSTNIPGTTHSKDTTHTDRLSQNGGTTPTHSIIKASSEGQPDLGQKLPATDSSATPYRKANTQATFVEADKSQGDTGTPVRKVGLISMNSSRTEPVKIVSMGHKPGGDNTFHGISLMMKDKSQGMFIEEGLTYDMKKPLGQGRFGKVLSGTYKGQRVAVKMCSDETYRSRFEREYEILASMQHSNIVNLVGIYRPPENGHGIVYVMEHMGQGSLLSFLRSSKIQNNPLSVQQKNELLIQVGEGMAYLFSHNCLHCDLKADNVLLNDEMIAKISDFGLAKRLDGEEVYDSYTRNGGLIKLNISAPETFKDRKFNTYSDIWSYGVLCIEVFLDGQEPNFVEPVNFKDMISSGNCSLLFEKIKAGERFQKPIECPEILYQVVLRCWDLNPKKRILYRDIIEEFKSYIEHGDSQTE